MIYSSYLICVINIILAILLLIIYYYSYIFVFIGFVPVLVICAMVYHPQNVQTAFLNFIYHCSLFFYFSCKLLECDTFLNINANFLLNVTS